MRIQIVFVSMLLASCSDISSYIPTFTPYKIEVRQGNLITQEMRDKLKLGMTQSQVKLVLGAPLINDVYHANRWDYIYRLNEKGELIENQRLTLFFDKDSLVRIEDATPLTASGHAIQEQTTHGKD